METKKCIYCGNTGKITAKLVKPRPASYFKGEKNPQFFENWDKQHVGEGKNLPLFNFRCRCADYPDHVKVWGPEDAKYYERVF